MGNALLRAIEHAADVLEKRGPTPVEKTIWGSPAGKKRIAARLVGMLPPHQTYVEPFAGSAAVLFEKEPAAVEAINDADADIARAYKTVQKLKPRDLAKLRGMSWVGDEATFKRLIDESPTSDVAWLHRFLYQTHFSYGKMRGKSFSPSVAGVEAKTVDRIVDVFPAAEKEMVRAMVSESLVAVISQTLCKLKDGSGRIAAHEIMLGTAAIRNLIRENKVAQMYSSIQTGNSLGMQTLDQNLADLVRRNIVAAAEARSKAKFPENFPG